MKNLYVHGSFMNDNFGDYLLFHIINERVKKFEKNYHIYYAETDESYHVYDDFKETGKWKAVWNADIAVLAGGGYFGEPDKDKLYWSFLFLLEHALPLLILRGRKIPYAIVGVGAGPAKYRLVRYLIKKIAEGAEIISVRDSESKEFLESLHIKKDIHIVPDWVMNYREEDEIVPQNNRERINTILEYKEKGYKIYFVHITTIQYQENNEKIFNYLNQIREEKILFVIGSDQARRKQRERAYHNYDRITNGEKCYLNYNNPWELLQILKMTDIIITDKLHVGIVGVKYGKNVYSFPIHSKTLRFYKQIGCEKKCIPLKDISVQKLNKVFGENTTINMAKKTADIVNESKDNEKILNDFLNKFRS